MFRVTVLGSSAAVPTKGRGLSSIALEREGELFLFDCGEGTQRQLARSALSRFDPSVILVTHEHGDHVLGIFGLIMSMSMHDRRAPLRIIAPSEVKRLLKCVLGEFETKFSYPIEFIEAKSGVVYRGAGYSIRATRAQHPGECYSFRFEEAKRPGRFHPEKAISLGVRPGPLFRRLQAGHSVRTAGGIVTPDMVMGPKRSGRSFGFSGDTRPVARLASFFREVDLLAFDCTYSDEYRKEARKFGHTTASEAAKLAGKAGVKKLLLTHISPRVSDTSVLLDQAKRIYPYTLVADDFMQIEVPFKD